MHHTSSSKIESPSSLVVAIERDCPETVSEEAFFFARSLDLLSVIGLDGYFKRINPMFTQTLGYSEAEFLASPFLDFVHPDDHRATLAEMEKLNTGMPTLYFENRYRAKDGSYRWLEWSASPQVDRGMIYCVARDITQQKQMEAERRELEAALQRANQELEQRVAERTAQLEQANTVLAEREALYRTLTQHIPNGAVHLFDHDLRYLLMEGNELKKLGLDGAELVGQTIWEVLPKETCKQIEPMYRAALAGEVSVQEVFYANQIYEVHTLPVRNARGEIFAGMVLTQNMTHRKQAEAQLQLSTLMLQRQLNEIETIYQSAPIGLNVLDTDLRFLRINQRFAEMNGFSVEAHIGRTVRELLPEIADTAEQILRHILETGQPLLNVEIIGETPAQPGVQRVWLESFLPLRDGDRVIGISTVCEEITERKRVESALRESEEFKQRMLESSNDCIKVLDLDGRLLYINPGGQCLMEIDNFESVRNGNWVTFWQGADRASTLEAIAAAKAGGFGRFQGYCATAKGTPKWWDVVVTPMQDADGRVIQLLSISRDITQRKQALDALRRSEERYRTLFETMEDGFCVIEMLFDQNNKPIDYRFLEINPAFERQSGLQQAVGKTMRQFLPNLEQHWFETYARVTLTGEPVRFENVSEVMNRHFEIYAFPIGQPEERKVAILFKEISDRKAIETQREQLLQREQTAREAAEQANRTKDQFLAVLSHELRTPLNPILGWAKLLQSPQISSEKLQQGLMTIERNAKQQVQLIEDLLDISRIIRGKLSLNFASVVLSEPIAAALETVRLAAEAKAIELEVFFDPSVEAINGDAGRLQQVVWNLLSNAVKFTPTGGRVTVQLTQVDRHAQIQVSDTGKGIEPGFLPFVFELFRQEDSSITRSFGGLGLGLAIARQVVEAHGGTISATSAGVGQGATFTVQLPLSKSESVNAPDLPEPPSLKLENLLVLVVDDEPDSSELIKVILEEQGAIVFTVSSGREALQILTDAQLDLLISDIGMPEMDGYTLIRKIRALSPQDNRDIPAIALTAYAGETNQRQAIAVGFQKHLAKPIHPQELLDAIAMLIK